MFNFRSKTSPKALALAIFLITTVTTLTAQVEEVIKVDSKDWKASVFGDIGGDISVITPNYFEITQKAADSFLLRSSSNKGKIASSSEGITYVYQEVSKTGNFKLSATVQIESYDMNNQVSCGIMLRDTVYENFGTKEGLGSYLSVGPFNVMNDPATTSFYRTPDVKTKSIGKMKVSKNPAKGSTYNLVLEKTGTTYILTFGNEEPEEFTTDIFNGNKLFIGIYTARNVTATFTNVKLTK